MKIYNCIVSNGCISETAYDEARTLFMLGEIPSNFSIANPDLQDFTNLCLDACEVDMEQYNFLIESLEQLEHCEAVMLGVLELIKSHE